jgi:hypothetical protein
VSEEEEAKAKTRFAILTQQLEDYSRRQEIIRGHLKTIKHLPIWFLFPCEMIELPNLKSSTTRPDRRTKTISRKQLRARNSTRVYLIRAPINDKPPLRNISY